MLPASADTLKGALTQAYQNNPQLNAQRAFVRATDETVPQALSGYRPNVRLTASGGVSYTDLQTAPGATAVSGLQRPRSVGLTVNQTLYNGQQTANGVRKAESSVSGE